MSAIKHRRKPNNPRQITSARMSRLETDLRDYGDLSGVIWNERTSNLVGGNQRSTVFKIDDCEIEITHQLDKPDAQGTTAFGYIVWNGNRYHYRRVNWEQEREDAACIKANVNAGLWDADKLANEWDAAQVLDWAGIDAAQWGEQKREVAMWGNMLESEENDPLEEWEGMPEFEQNKVESYKSITLHFQSADSVKNLSELLGQPITEKTKYIWFPPKERQDLKALSFQNES